MKATIKFTKPKRTENVTNAAGSKGRNERVKFGLWSLYPALAVVTCVNCDTASRDAEFMRAVFRIGANLLYLNSVSFRIC